jgi:hypothetical protein
MTTSPPTAVLVGGRIVSAADHTDAYLRPGQVAERLKVAAETVSRWLAAPPGSRYGPGGELPYPALVDGQHVDVGGVTYVLASALDAWAAATASVQRQRGPGGQYVREGP